MHIAVVDDEKNIRRSFELILKGRASRVDTWATGAELLSALERGPASEVIFLDVLLGAENGIEVLKAVKAGHPDIEVVMISGHANLAMAVEATRAGAWDFLEKPLQKEKVLLTLTHLAERRTLKRRFADLQESVAEEYRLIGESPALAGVLARIEKVAPTDSKVLITGESGVGKELVAFAIHGNSGRAGGPFVKLNCAAIPEDLIESELFGSEKGAFTGAVERREGKFFAADGGTLFLDEVGDMSLTVQTKVLRVLQDGEFQRVGGKDVLRSDARVIAATNRDLEAMVREGTFREDLYFRLNVLPIEVPPLRERSGDIPALVTHFIGRYCRRNNRRAVQVASGVMAVLKRYAWPGNIRELQNLTERLVILCDNDRITPADLPASLLQPAAAPSPPGSRTLSEVRDAAERDYIRACLESCGWNVSQAARLLGVERTNLHKKMKSLGIER